MVMLLDVDQSWREWPAMLSHLGMTSVEAPRSRKVNP